MQNLRYNMERLSRYGANIGLILGLIGLVPCAWAQTPITYNWTNTSGGVFGVAGNWSPSGGPPAKWGDANDEGDIIEFNLNSSDPYTVTFGAADNFGIVYVCTDKVIFNLGGNELLSGRISSGSVFVGSGSGHTATLIVTNGTWYPFNHWQIGHSGGTGTLINDGAWLKRGNVNISNYGYGTYIIRNGGRHTNAGNMLVGDKYAATMIISNAGSYKEVNGVVVKNNSELVLADGGYLQCAMRIGIYSNSVATLNGGELRLRQGTTYSDVNYHLDLRGTLRGTGIVTNYFDDKLYSAVNSGSIEPGGAGAVGQLTLYNASYTQTTGVVKFEIAGGNPGEYDRLVIGGPATFEAGASCEVTFLEAYAPTQTTAYQLMSATSFSGEIGTVNLPALPPQWRWDTSQLQVTGELIAERPPSRRGTVITIN